MIINNEHDVFIKVLKNFIHKEVTTTPENINWGSIKEYANKHQVEAIFYSQTKNSIFLHAYAYQVYRAVQICEEVKKIDNLLKNMRYFIVKGMEIAKYYPTSFLRSMGDVDIIVDNKELAAKVLEQTGYKRSDYGLEEIAMTNGIIQIELHDHLLYSEVVNEKKQSDFINNYWNYVYEGKLDVSFHFLYLILHLRKHFLNSGVGFRQFMDIAVLVKYAELDWNWIINNARDIDLLPFLDTVLAFVEKWFDVASPLSTKDLSMEFFLTMTEKIMIDGVFGFDNLENKGNLAVIRNNKNGIKGSFGNMFKYIFISYSDAIKNPEYSFLINKKWAMPVFWIYRIFRKFGNRKNIIRWYIVDNAYKEKRNIQLKQWGLK